MGEHARTCEMHIGDLRLTAPSCGRPATWRFPAEVGGFIYACDQCIGAGRAYAERIDTDVSIPTEAPHDHA
jgi:hypothetical protein